MIRKDLKIIDVGEDKWYDEANSSRAKLRALCRDGLENHERGEGASMTASVEEGVRCEECQRTFRRESDRKRHKCISERMKPVSEQRGSIQCSTCKRWFHSRGGYSVYVCRPEDQR